MFTFLSQPLVSGAESPRDIDEAKVSDDGSPILQEDIFGLEILVDNDNDNNDDNDNVNHLVDNAPVVEITHALGDLLSY